MPTATSSSSTPGTERAVLRSRILASLEEVRPAHWNGLGLAGRPFLRHEFLAAAERSGSATDRTGWVPAHVVVESGGRLASGARDLGAAACHKLAPVAIQQATPFRGCRRLRHGVAAGSGRTCPAVRILHPPTGRQARYCPPVTGACARNQNPTPPFIASNSNIHLDSKLSFGVSLTPQCTN